MAFDDPVDSIIFNYTGENMYDQLCISKIDPNVILKRITHLGSNDCLRSKNFKDLFYIDRFLLEKFPTNLSIRNDIKLNLMFAIDTIQLYGPNDEYHKNALFYKTHMTALLN